MSNANVGFGLARADPRFRARNYVKALGKKLMKCHISRDPKP